MALRLCVRRQLGSLASPRAAVIPKVLVARYATATTSSLAEDVKHAIKVSNPAVRTMPQCVG